MKTKRIKGYPSYPANEDVFRKYLIENEINPEDISKIKNRKSGPINTKEDFDDPTGGDLDIPGVDLDYDQENTGDEDEENNFYSLGGDDHDDLEEHREE